MPALSPIAANRRWCRPSVGFPAALAGIMDRLNGAAAPADAGGDLAFTVRPLPKIVLCYLCYLADEDFPAGVTCLYSNNAHLFLPTDALADVGEYTTRTLLAMLNHNA